MTSVPKSFVVTIEYLDAALATDPRPSAASFMALSISTKTWYLKRATQNVCAVPRLDWPFGGPPIPDEFRRAAVEEALALHEDYSTAGPGGLDRKKLQEHGVTSFTLGPLSETYMSKSTQTSWSGSAGACGLHSKDAYGSIRMYIAGSVRTVH